MGAWLFLIGGVQCERKIFFGAFSPLARARNRIICHSGQSVGGIQWIKQVIGLCLTAFLQSTILVAGLMVFKDHALLGLGLMLSAGEVPRIAGTFGLDTTTRANIMSAVYTAQAAVNTTRTIVQAVASK